MESKQNAPTQSISHHWRKIRLSSLLSVAVLISFSIAFAETAPEAPTNKGNPWSSACKNQDPDPLISVLQQSVFAYSVPPTTLANGLVKTYSPIAISVIASLSSREPSRTTNRWKPVQLPPTESSKACRGKFKGFFRASKTNSPYSFVVLPGSYATFQRGSFLNQTLATLDKRFQDPNVLAFDGYLSPEFLSGTCNQIPWNNFELAADFYQRIKNFFASSKIRTRNGVIGFSGGGALTIGMLSHDSIAVINAEDRFFELGGVSFSPILHGATTFANLDFRYKNSPIDRSLGLTTPDSENLLYLATHGFQPPSWKEIEGLYKKNPIAFEARAFNEFTAVDLRDILKSVGEKIPDEKKLNYHNVFVEFGFGRSNPGLLPKDLDSAFETATDLKPVFRSIDAPLLVYFSKDDPVLSSHDATGQPPAITELLDDARSNPCVRIFNPEFGAHVGGLLDPIFEDLMDAAFRRANPL